MSAAPTGTGALAAIAFHVHVQVARRGPDMIAGAPAGPGPTPVIEPLPGKNNTQPL